jgi:hypothetical protein
MTSTKEKLREIIKELKRYAKQNEVGSKDYFNWNSAYACSARAVAIEQRRMIKILQGLL